MGYREGAPSWVIQNRANAEASSLRSQIYQLQERVKTLEEENISLRKQLDESNRRYEEHVGGASQK